jgi:predicted metal-dependent HD superfamily phosphohydrolase
MREAAPVRWMTLCCSTACYNAGAGDTFQDLVVGSMDRRYFQLGCHDRDFLYAQWVSLTSQYAPNRALIESLFNFIVEHYSASERAYHNLSHIQSLITLSESLLDKIQNRDAHYFSIWFHDLIYDTRRSDNEEKSAEFAAEALASLGVPEQTVAVVREMILATKHHRGDDLSWDAKAFLDLDTSILGAPEEIYEEYSRAIRKEYSWVPDVLYREGRMKVLSDFLGRERVYQTEEIRAKYETQARHNIAEEIRALSD